MYFLSIVMCFVNENDYLKEWLDFHIKMGVDHFYLYNTGVGEKYLPEDHQYYIDSFVKKMGLPEIAEETDDERFKIIFQDPIKILQPYIDKGIITYHKWEQSFDQAKIYNHAYRTYGKINFWMAFIDSDEFLHPANKKESLKSVLWTFRSYPSVAVHSLFFGSSGHMEKTDQPVLERFTFRADDKCEIKGYNDLSKIIAQPKFIRKFKNAHSCYLINNLKGVNTNRDRIGNKACNRPIYHNVLRVNHYHIKSRDEFLIRHAIGRHDGTPELNITRFMSKEVICNQVEDTTIQDVLEYANKTK